MPGRIKTFHPVRANAGIEAEYRRRMNKLIGEMQSSVLYWVRARYKANEPKMSLALDATPAAELQDEILKLRRRWQGQFKDAAPELARWFARSSSRRTDMALRSILKKGGFTVEMRTTPAQRDILRASINENVSLIKSIPEQYFTQIEGMVMRSVQAGRDLGTLSRDLEARYGVTKRRAALIARDQNNKATAVLTRARQVELGLTKAIWRHSHAGKEPRPTHLANDGEQYDTRKGWFDPAERKWIFPGELVNCRCYSVAVVPGFG